MMLKKYTALLFLSLAYALLLGHNVIPHHHHDNENSGAEHHHHADHHHSHHHDTDYAHSGQSHEEHNENDEKNDLSHLFSYFFHSPDGITLSHQNSNWYLKQVPVITAIIPDHFDFSEIFNPPLLYKPPADFLIYITPHSTVSGLRAPPAFFI